MFTIDGPLTLLQRYEACLCLDELLELECSIPKLAFDPVDESLYPLITRKKLYEDLLVAYDASNWKSRAFLIEKLVIIVFPHSCNDFDIRKYPWYNVSFSYVGIVFGGDYDPFKNKELMTLFRSALSEMKAYLLKMMNREVEIKKEIFLNKRKLHNLNRKLKKRKCTLSLLDFIRDLEMRYEGNYDD